MKQFFRMENSTMSAPAGQDFEIFLVLSLWPSCLVHLPQSISSSGHEVKGSSMAQGCRPRGGRQGGPVSPLLPIPTANPMQEQA